MKKCKQFLSGCLLGLLTGCAGQHRQIPSHLQWPATTGAPVVMTLGLSVNARPITLHRFGTGGRSILLIAAIHGDEPTTTAIAEGLMGELHQNPLAGAGLSIAIIPVANPDGLVARTRVNAHHIDLNRNFPAGNWSAPPFPRRSPGGQSAASEPETRALMMAIENLNPRLIISVHSMDKPSNNYDGPAQRIAEGMQSENGYAATSYIGYPTPGSLGSYAGIDRRIPMITLELPAKLSREKAWPDNRAAILAALAATRSNNFPADR